MAIEDGICLARLLLPETPAGAVHKRLQTFEELRYQRVEFVRNETRQNGLDEDKRPNSTSFNCSRMNTCTSFLLTEFPRHVPDDEILLRA